MRDTEKLTRGMGKDINTRFVHTYVCMYAPTAAHAPAQAPIQNIKIAGTYLTKFSSVIPSYI